MRKQNEFSTYYYRNSFLSLHLNVCLDVLEQLGTARSLAIAIAIRANEVSKELFDINPDHYFDAYSYYLDSQAANLVKKTMLIDFSVNSNEVVEQSISKWKQIESELEIVNREILSRKNFLVNSTVDSAAKILQNLLPRTIKPRQQPIPSGATASLSGLNVHIANKLEVLDITPTACSYWHKAYGKSILNDTLSKKIVKSAKLETVPKTVFSRRIIVKEPMGNMMLQLDAAKALRYSLGKVGIDLATQQNFHQFIVENFHEEFATIDLSDASDRISYELVKKLIPEEWFYYLDKIRSRSVVLPDNTTHTLEKFCAQGNGFNFELETLLFYAICRTVVPANELVSVYGDDMIVPVHHAVEVMNRLVSVGLVVNFKKSYHKGPFRESCGTDTFNGINVRSIYFKDFRDGLYGYYELFNCLVKMEQNLYPNALNRAKRRVLSKILEKHRNFGPSLLGDSVLHSDSYKTITIDNIRYVRVLQTQSLIGRVKYEKYYSIPSNFNSTYKELSYALLGFSSNGTLHRSAPQFEKFSKCPI